VSIAIPNWRKIGLVIVGWTLFAFFFTSQLVVNRVALGRAVNFGYVLIFWLICAGLWFAATPLVVWLARRFPFDRLHWLRTSLVHLVAGSILSLGLLTLYLVILFLTGLKTGENPFLPELRNLLANSFHTEVLTYWIVVGLSNAFDYYHKYRERELRAAQLETKLAQAQLDALKMQLHPHFLFNTLNSISVLMSDDVPAARRMLIRLSDLLRTSLERNGEQEVTLREELEFLRNYLEIEQTRFQDRLSVNMEIDPSALDAQVPNLILQPLVENAIRHGIAPQARPGVVEIQARRENGMVRMRVRDNGAGLKQKSTPLNGIGLGNTRARLEQLYNSHHRFEMREPPDGGFAVTIAIPFRNQNRER
jgi:signal transduction histidine kinase